MNKKKKPAELKQEVLNCLKLRKEFYLAGQKTGKNKAIKVLQNINFSLSAGERVAILGSSGTGKTTLLTILGGLEKPSAGQVQVDGMDITNMKPNQLAKMRNGKIGFVYQFHHLLMEFTATENVAIPLVLGAWQPAEALKRAVKMLKMVGLSKRLEHKPGELSGGERQRVAVARALAGDPLCVLLDEPTGNLDENTAEAVHNMLLRLSKKLGIALLAVTHDYHLASMMDKQYMLEHGELRALSKKTTLVQKRISKK